MFPNTKLQFIAQVLKKVTEGILPDKISSINLHLVLQTVDLVKQQATVVTLKSEISCMMCLHMQFQFIAQIRQKATVETLRDNNPSMSLHMKLQLVALVQQKATVETVKFEIYSMYSLYGTSVCSSCSTTSYRGDLGRFY